MPSVAVLALILTIVLFFIALLFLLRNSKQKSCNAKLPPGNMGLPLIGETFAFLKPHSVLTAGDFLERHIAKFGRIFLSNLMGSQVIVSADGELNRFVLKNEPRLFGPGWPLAFKKVAGKDSISVVVGEAHKALRSTVTEFLSGNRLRSVFLRDANELASLLISSWKEGSVISARDEATKFSLYIMAKEILSLRPGDPAIEKLRMEYESFVRGLGCLPLYVPGTLFWKALHSRERIVKFFKQKVEDRTRNKSDRNAGTEEDDFMGWLMKNTSFTPEKIGNFLLGVLFAGHDTASRAISLLVYFLERCPKAIEKLQEEHLQVLRSKEQEGGLTWDAYKSMEFTKCVINETLRLGSIATHVQKEATQDVVFKEYVIPQGQKILVHLSAVHLDPSLYEEPEHFNPWRWLTSSSVKMINGFMPFGGGMRMCPGAELARLEMAVFLHHLILNYDWELVEPDHPIHNPMVEFPKGLPIRVRTASGELKLTQSS